MEKTVQSCDSPLSVPSLLNHLIRPLKHANWNCKTNLLCRLEVNDEFKLRCLRYRQVTRFRSLEDFVHVNSRALLEVSVVLTVRHEAALVDKFLLKINSW